MSQPDDPMTQPPIGTGGGQPESAAHQPQVQPLQQQAQSLPPNLAQFAPPSEPSIFAQITQAQWLSGLKVGGLAFGVLFGVSLVITLLVVIAGGGDSGFSGDLGGLGSQWFPGIFQIMGAAFFSPFKANYAESYSASVFLFPAVVPVLALWLTLKFGRKVTGDQVIEQKKPRVIVASAVGLAFAIVLIVVSSIFSVRIDDGYGDAMTFRAISFWGFVISGIAIGTVTYLILSQKRAARTPGRWSLGLRTMVEHLTTLTVVLGVAGYFYFLFADDGSLRTLFALPLVAPLLGANLLTLGTFGAIGGSADIMELGGSGGSINVFSEGIPIWGTIVLILAVVLAILIASVRWWARRISAGTPRLDGATLPLLYAAGGFGIFLLGSIFVSTGVDDMSATASMGPAAWVLFLIAIAGLLVELCAIYLVPEIYSSLPPSVVKSVLVKLGPALGVAPVAPVAPAQAAPAQPAPAVPIVPQPSATASPFANTMPAVDGAGTQAQSSVSGYPASNEAELHKPATLQQPVVPAPPQPGAQAHTIPVPQYQPPTPAAPPTPRAPLSKKAKRAWIAGTSTVVGLAVLITVGVTVKNKLAETTYGPQAQVENYLDALVAGKASDALAIFSPNVKDSQRGLLTDEVYGATENRPTAYRIESTDISEDGARVVAQVKQDGMDYEADFVLKKDGKQALIFDDWRVTSAPVQYIRMYSLPDSTLVNGVEVNLPAVKNSNEFETDFDGESYMDVNPALEGATLPVLPGTYTFTAPKGTKYLTYGDDITILVTPEDLDNRDDYSAQGVYFSKSYTNDVVLDASNQVLKAMQACISPGTIVIEGCEISSWEDMSWDAMTNVKRSWYSGPEIVVTTRQEADDAYGQPEPSSLNSDELVAVVVDGDIAVDYDVRDAGDTDEDGKPIWYEDHFTSISPFYLGSSSWEGSRVTFPITLDGDNLTVDTSALGQIHEDWVRPEHRK